jgi:tetratricopeptide (TPR) repeat protein
MPHTPLDPNALPGSTERRRVADELRNEAITAMQRGEPLVASLCIADALMLFPNERPLLDVIDKLVLGSQDPLGLFPVATGAIHVATAAARARALYLQRRFPDAVELLGRVLEAAPELEYVDWIRRWLTPPFVPQLTWDQIMGAIVKPILTMTIDVAVPPDPRHPYLPNLRSAAPIFDVLLPAYPGEKVLYMGTAMIRRRLGDTAATLAVAEEGVRRFPQDWGLRTALLNALRDAKRPDEALQQAQVAMQLDPKDLAPLHDAAWGFADAGRFDHAAHIFQDVAQRQPDYPTIDACVHYAHFRAFGSEQDRHALLVLRERRYWDNATVRMANELDPPVPYFTTLIGPADAAARYGRMMIAELGEVLRCCGQGASIGVTIQSRYPESPSARIAFDVGMRSMGAGSAQMAVEIERAPSPDPRADKGRVDYPVWTTQGGELHPVFAQGDPNAQHAVGTIAYSLFRKEVWDPAARAIAQAAGPHSARAFLSVLTNPPPPPPEYDGVIWTYRCQIAAAVVLSHLGPWESGPARGVLYSMVSGPSDWITIAGIVALAWRAQDNPAARTEVEGCFRWLRSLIPQEGFTPWEGALASAWLSLGAHPEPLRAELEGWRAHYEETLPEKNVVRPMRRYGGLTLEQYAEFSVERDKLQGGLAYGGVGAAMQAAFSPSPQMAALCQKFGVPNAGKPFIDEWQEALNANAELMDEFVEAKRAIELGQMGINKEEKGALDRILAGDMDMHQRMAQAQEAQRLAAAPDADPDPVVFPGQRVARLSDYVRIMKGMQSGNMMGALSQYGLDIMSYGQVAQAWSAKMAADPVLTEKFSKMMK